MLLIVISFILKSTSFFFLVDPFLRNDLNNEIFLLQSSSLNFAKIIKYLNKKKKNRSILFEWAKSDHHLLHNYYHGRCLIDVNLRYLTPFSFVPSIIASISLETGPSYLFSTRFQLVMLPGYFAVLNYTPPEDIWYHFFT